MAQLPVNRSILLEHMDINLFFFHNGAKSWNNVPYELNIIPPADTDRFKQDMHDWMCNSHSNHLVIF